jgi:hypothetical protein
MKILVLPSLHLVLLSNVDQAGSMQHQGFSKQYQE